jgi:hypothetical protein
MTVRDLVEHYGCKQIIKILKKKKKNDEDDDHVLVGGRCQMWWRLMEW